MKDKPLPRDENRFRFLSDEPLAVIPPGTKMELDIRTTREMMADRIAKDKADKERREDLAKRLRAKAELRSIYVGCKCSHLSAKLVTEVVHHQSDCTYRLLMEAADEIECL